MNHLRPIKEYSTLTVCFLLGPIFGMMQNWTYIVNYLSSYIHNSDSSIGLLEVNQTLNFLVIGNLLGGVTFYSVIKTLGYKNGFKFNILVNILSFY